MLTSMMDEPLLLRSSVCVVGGAENANQKMMNKLHGWENNRTGRKAVVPRTDDGFLPGPVVFPALPSAVIFQSCIFHRLVLSSLSATRQSFDLALSLLGVLSRQRRVVDVDCVVKSNKTKKTKLTKPLCAFMSPTFNNTFSCTKDVQVPDHEQSFLPFISQFQFKLNCSGIIVLSFIRT